jgi:hypothetical protein
LIRRSMLKCSDFSRPNFAPARSPHERSDMRVRSASLYAAPGFRFSQPGLRRNKMKDMERRQTHCSRSDCSQRTRTQRRTGRATEKAACAALPLRARSPAGVPPRLCPRGVWSLGAIRARLRGQTVQGAGVTPPTVDPLPAAHPACRS